MHELGLLLCFFLLLEAVCGEELEPLVFCELAFVEEVLDAFDCFLICEYSFVDELHLLLCPAQLLEAESAALFVGERRLVLAHDGGELAELLAVEVCEGLCALVREVCRDEQLVELHLHVFGGSLAQVVFEDAFVALQQLFRRDAVCFGGGWQLRQDEFFEARGEGLAASGTLRRGEAPELVADERRHVLDDQRDLLAGLRPGHQLREQVQDEALAGLGQLGLGGLVRGLPVLVEPVEGQSEELLELGHGRFVGLEGADECEDVLLGEAGPAEVGH